MDGHCKVLWSKCTWGGHAASEQLHELSPQGGLALELDELVGLQSVPLPCGAPTNTVDHRTPARTPHPAM